MGLRRKPKTESRRPYRKKAPAGRFPIEIRDHYEIDYRHSYAQDSPFFVGLTQGKLLGSRCRKCAYAYATPRGHCDQCGSETEWMALPLEGKVHTHTTCYYSGESFMKETPFTLILVEFEKIDTLFLSRLKGAKPDSVRIGMAVKARFAMKHEFRITDVHFIPK